LAAVQVIVYAGAIMVLFLFVIMLLGEDKPLPGEGKLAFQTPLGALFALVLVGEIVYTLVRQPSVGPTARPSVALIGAAGAPVHSVYFGSVEAIGNTLFTDYLFAFEATSLVLLVAMVGVVVLAKRKL